MNNMYHNRKIIRIQASGICSIGRGKDFFDILNSTSKIGANKIFLKCCDDGFFLKIWIDLNDTVKVNNLLGWL